VDWDKHLPSILAWGGSVVTGLFTLLGVWLANKSSLKQLTVKLQHESEKERNDALRTRLEELYCLVDHWAKEMVTHHITYRKVMDGDLTYNQALDLTISNKSTLDSTRLFMLAELYFPSAQKALEELKELRDKASSVQDNFKQCYKLNGQPSAEHAKALTALLQRFNDAIDKYQAELAAYAHDV